MIDRANTCYDGTMAKPPSRLEARTEAILRATLEELAEVGYASLSFESIASRVGIAKTTVYRRYSTKAVLVKAAIERFVDSAVGELPDTGSLRGDLIALAQQAVSISTSAVGQALFKLGLGRRDAELVELFAMSRDFEAEKSARDAIVATRAVARGEVTDAGEFKRLLDVIVGSFVFKVAIMREAVNEVEIGRTVDMLLNGVSRPDPAVSKRKPSSR